MCPSTRYFCTYRISEQRMLRRVFVYAVSPEPSLLAQFMNVDDGRDKML